MMMQSVFMAMMCDEEGTINLVLMMLVCFCSRFDARSCVMVYSYATVRIKLFAFESNMGCSYYSSANFIYSTYNDACKLQLIEILPFLNLMQVSLNYAKDHNQPLNQLQSKFFYN